jgi:hypothetical protein
MIAWGLSVMFLYALARLAIDIIEFPFRESGSTTHIVRCSRFSVKEIHTLAPPPLPRRANKKAGRLG